MTKIYFIHDNGGRPFKVEIQNLNETNEIQNNCNVKIYRILGMDSDDENYNEDIDDTYETEPCLEYQPERVFVGLSPQNMMTAFSLGFGTQFDGNSILLHLKDNLYVSIGSEIYTFTTEPGCRIIKYLSPVGNNDVPYPFALDDHDNCYLMIEDVVVKNIPQKYHDTDEQYIYYYDSKLITVDKGRIPPRIPRILNFQGIHSYYHGTGEHYTFVYTPKPDSNYDRLSRFDDFGDGIWIKYTSGESKRISKEEYIKIMEDFGNLMGFKSIENKIVVQRRFW